MAAPRVPLPWGPALRVEAMDKALFGAGAAAGFAVAPPGRAPRARRGASAPAPPQPPQAAGQPSCVDQAATHAALKATCRAVRDALAAKPQLGGAADAAAAAAAIAAAYAAYKREIAPPNTMAGQLQGLVVAARLIESKAALRAARLGAARMTEMLLALWRSGRAARAARARRARAL
jgi:hypothetical protein